MKKNLLLLLLVPALLLSCLKESQDDYKKRVEARISLCAEDVLRARGNHPNHSLADLYDPLTMPPDLLKAHRVLDKAVMELYGYTLEMSEPEIVADLMVRYQKLVEIERFSAVGKGGEQKPKSKRTRQKKDE